MLRRRENAEVGDNSALVVSVRDVEGDLDVVVARNNAERKTIHGGQRFECWRTCRGRGCQGGGEGEVILLGRRHPTL